MTTYFVALWAQSSSAFFWPIWPAISWGIGLYAHATHVFGWVRAISEEQIQREIHRSF